MPPVSGEVPQHLLRRSPKSWRLTATTFRIPRSLLTTRASASASTSSAMTRRSLWPVWTSFSSTGTRSVVPLIFLSVISMYGSSTDASIRCRSLTKYGEI